MTMKELSQLHWLNVEIDRDKQRLAELEARAASPGGPNMSGMPGGGGAGSSVESAALEIVELKASIEAKIIRCATERARLIGYIDAVPDSRIYRLSPHHPDLQPLPQTLAGCLLAGPRHQGYSDHLMEYTGQLCMVL